MLITGQKQFAKLQRADALLGKLRNEIHPAGEVKVRQDLDAPVSASVAMDVQHGLLYVATLAGTLLCFQAKACLQQLR